MYRVVLVGCQGWKRSKQRVELVLAEAALMGQPGLRGHRCEESGEHHLSAALVGLLDLQWACLGQAGVAASFTSMAAVCT